MKAYLASPSTSATDPSNCINSTNGCWLCDFSNDKCWLVFHHGVTNLEQRTWSMPGLEKKSNANKHGGILHLLWLQTSIISFSTRFLVAWSSTDYVRPRLIFQLCESSRAWTKAAGWNEPWVCDGYMANDNMIPYSYGFTLIHQYNHYSSLITIKQGIILCLWHL